MPAFRSTMPEGALSWESQVVQYRDARVPSMPGITYYAGVVEGRPRPIDCLLYWDKVGGKLRIVGILNHYPVDYPPWEKAGNVNLWVRRTHQRRGIGTALWEEAVRRWSVTLEGQRFTDSGAALANHLAERGK